MRPELLERYAGERLPRYTSYPPSPFFTPAVTAADYRAWLASLGGGHTASLYVHVPFCRSMCWYCGCHTTVALRDAPIKRHLAALRREIQLVSAAAPVRLAATHIHFGGGTPTILAPADFAALMDLLRDCFAVAETAEIAVEIDPRTLTAEMVSGLAEAGVTRASLGVQSFDPVVQGAINRVQSFAVTALAVERLRRAGIGGLNFDLIYGLPHQTVASCLDTVARCLALKPDRFAVFGYAHVPSFKKHQQKIDTAVLPSAIDRYAQAESIAAALETAGYVRIGLDHFAVPQDDMAIAQAQGRLHRNFQGYTTDCSGALLGFGASAIGRLPQGYVQNEVALPQYEKRLEANELPLLKGYTLTRADRLRAELIERIMCDFRVDIDDVCRRHGLPVGDIFAAAPTLAMLENDGVVRVDGAHVEVERDARPLVRTVAAAFDAYLGASGRSHSPAV
jgi:oxygen-independent coproporphyrinogen-3 oxidase